MVWVGFALLWVGYTGFLYGQTLIKGYNISLGQLVKPPGYQGEWGSKAPKAGNTQIFPDGKASGAQTTALVVAGGSAGTSGGGAATPAGITNTNAIASAAKPYGWDKGPEWAALTQIVNAESRGNPLIANPSGAFGIGQALGHGTSGSGGSPITYTVTTSPPTQVSGQVNQYGGYGLSDAQAQAANSGNAYWQSVWMMNYIKATYGDPIAAWAFHVAHNWY